MPTTQQTIYQKLLEFHKNNIKVTKGGTNPAFRSKYATLNDVLEAVKQPLTDVGIVIVQTTEQRQADIGLLTKLVSVEDGSSIESYIPYVDISTPQKLGSNNTYNRRYALVTMLSLEDEDDDGNAASHKSTDTAREVFSNPRATQTSFTDEKVPDGEHTVMVQSVKKGVSAKTGNEWTAVNTEIGRMFNNSGVELVENVTYDIVVRNGAIVEVKEDNPF